MNSGHWLPKPASKPADITGDRILLDDYIDFNPEKDKNPKIWSKKKKKDFELWIYNKVSLNEAYYTVKYLNDYFSGEEIKTPADALNIINSEEKLGVRRRLEKGFRNLLTYLEEKEIISEEIAEKFRKHIKVEKSGAKGQNINDVDVKEAWQWIKEHRGEKEQKLWQTIVYTGIRGEHAIRFLETFNKENLEFENGIARYDSSKLGRGGKKGYWIFLPIDFAKSLKQYKFGENPLDDIRYRKVNASQLRKWHLNVMRLKKYGLKVDQDVAEFIQGRGVYEVGSTHYFEMTEAATEEAPDILRKINEIVFNS